MLELGTEFGLVMQSTQNLVSLGVSEVAAVVQGTPESVEPLRESHDYRVLNQEIIGRLAEGAGRFINWAIAFGVVICVFFAILGFIKLNRAADSPQLRNSAIGQIVFSVIAGAGVTLVWVFIGFGIEFGDVISGGAAVDVGSVGTGGSGAVQERTAGDLIGFYGQNAVICNAQVGETTKDSSGSAEWTWDSGEEKCTQN